MSLETGEKKNGQVVATLPITQEVINRVEELDTNQGQPFRASKMLQYEWRHGRPIAQDDVEIEEEDTQQSIIPDPIVQHTISPAGPNPFNANIQNNLQNQGAEDVQDNRNNNLAQGDYEHLPELLERDQHQGAQDTDDENQKDKNQGAQNASTEINDDDISDDKEKVIESEDIIEDDNDNHEDNVRRSQEKERRGAHFKVHVGEEYGRGKRKKIQRSFSFFQTQFKDLSQEGKEEFFKHAWDEYQLSGKTNMLERYTTGLVFAQLSAKQGITRYDREAELKLLAEFKQLLDYKTFHGVKAENLTHE